MILACEYKRERENRHAKGVVILAPDISTACKQVQLFLLLRFLVHKDPCSQGPVLLIFTSGSLPIGIPSCPNALLGGDSKYEL